MMSNMIKIFVKRRHFKSDAFFIHAYQESFYPQYRKYT